MAGGEVDDGDRAPSQAGVIEGAIPTKYNPSDPLTLFIIQVRQTRHGGMAPPTGFSNFSKSHIPFRWRR